MSLKVFLDTFSQPCRAVMLLLEVNKVSYEPCILKIAKGENRSDEYKAINPTRTVPSIDDGGFCLFESAAIMKYIVQKYKLPDHWYPSNPQKQAKINEYLHWHHQNLRVGAAHTIYQKFFVPGMTGAEPDEEKIKHTIAVLRKSEKLLETYFLKDTQYINSNEISIADLQAICEFTTFWITGMDPFQDKPRLAKWMEDCKKELQPHFDGVHKMVYLARDKGTFKGKL